MKNIFEKIGINLLKLFAILLGVAIITDIFIVINELLGNQEIVEKMDKFIINLF